MPEKKFYFFGVFSTGNCEVVCGVFPTLGVGSGTEIRTFTKKVYTDGLDFDEDFFLK